MKRKAMWALAMISGIAAFLIIFFIYKCPTRYIFGIPCATCGMTRAFLSAAKLDFKAAFYYHPLFGIIGIELIYLIFRKLILKKIKINIKLEIGVLIFTGVLLITTYIIRLYLGIIP